MNKLYTLIPVRLLFFICFFLNAENSFSQNTFIKSTGSINSDYGVACQPTYDDGTILVALTSTSGIDVHYALVKTDELGNVEWYKIIQIGEWTQPHNVLQAKDEGYIVYGDAADSSYLNNNKHYLFLHKTDFLGNTLWHKEFSLSLNDLAMSLVHRKAGGYYCCSTADYNLGSYPRTAITRLDEDGNIVWSRQYTVPYGTQFPKIVELENGNICFTAGAGLNFPANPFVDIVVTMLNDTGDVIWSKSIGTYYDDEPNAIATNANNEVFITGRVYFMGREWDSYLLRMDSSGNIIQYKSYDAGTSNGEIMRCVVAKDDGSCVLLGDMGAFCERDIVFLGIDTGGAINTANQFLFSPMFTNYPYELYPTADGGYIFTGDVRPPTALRDAYIVKTDSLGETYCLNTTPLYTVHADTFHVSNLVIGLQGPAILLHNDTSTHPLNPFAGHIVCAGTTGTEDIDSENIDFRIFPNPASDYLIVESIFERINQIKIYSIEGNLIHEELLNSSDDNIKISLRYFSAGIYIIDCISDKFSKKIKVIKN
jgi:hypothetical protein